MAKKRKSEQISPEQALRFLEDMRLFHIQIDGPRKMISLRIPENLLRSLKAKAGLEKRPYQSLLIDYVRTGLLQEEQTGFRPNRHAVKKIDR